VPFAFMLVVFAALATNNELLYDRKLAAVKNVS
jgi:hypothetical protein